MPDHSRARIGLATAMALVVGNMIGSGLFLLPASLAPFGASALLGWTASAIGALALAAVFAALSRRWPRSGGPYAYARAAFGDATGFAIAWSYWISIWCGNAAIAIGFAGYAGSLLPALTATPLRGALTACAGLWACTLANAFGVRSAGIVQLVTTVLKLVPLLAFAVLAFAIAPVAPDAWQPFDRSGGGALSALTATAALTLWAFLGVECATIPAADVRDPQRNVPRATIIGTAIAIVATVASCMAVVGLLPEAALAKSTAPFADAARAVWGDAAALAFAVAAAVACIGALNGWVLMQAQVPLAAARDGLFPRLFAHVDRRGTPLPGLLAGSALASALVLANFHQQLVQLFTFSVLLSTAATLLPYVVCSAAHLRMQIGAGANGSRTGAGIAAIALVFSVGALIGCGGEALLWGALLVVAGWPLWRWQDAHRARHIDMPNGR